ncbi:MAG: metallophosphoesterase family protein [Nanoarchaeota archaeon]
MGRKLKFLATGDIHSDKNFLKNLRKNVDMKNIDYVLFTGDLSEKKDDFKDLLSFFEGKPVIMVPGNHESKRQIDSLKKHYGVHVLGNNPIVFDDDLAIFASNYLAVGPYGVPEQEVFRNQIVNFKNIERSKIKIMMSHLPPDGTLIGGMSPFFPIISGSVATRVFLEHFEPDVVFVGHIHESGGLEEIVNKSKVVNVGRSFRVFSFDPDTKKLEFELNDKSLNCKKSKSEKKK